MRLQKEPENLILKYLRNELTEEERSDLEVWKQKSARNMEVFETLTNEETLAAELNVYQQIDKEKGFKKLQKEFAVEEIVNRESGVVRRIHIWKKIAVAASIVGLLFIGYWLMKDKTTDDGPQTTVVQTNDVQAPDKNRAQIKLADGTIVYLDSAGSGTLATQGNVNVVKTADGAIAYKGASTPAVGGTGSLSMTYNTLFNPRGSIVMNMTLSDGSRVWLNAGSSVTYPVAFVGNERKVSIEGEAYFEIAYDKTKPFIVSAANKADVTVLGTHFNVNAYDDEDDIKVTLLEGSVKISNEQSSLTIKPNQQAIIKSGNAVALNSSVDIAEVMAWKNGQFYFENSSVETIMRQAERWYDLEVVFEDKISHLFVAKIPRGVPVSELLKLLELTERVHFKIEGKKVTVMK